jgi:hypothetical protein
MEIFFPPLARIDIEETRRYAGLRSGADFSEDLLAKACTEALLVARPQAAWNIQPYMSAAATVAAPAPLRLSGKDIARHLAGAEQVAVLAVTIGKNLEAEVSRLFAAGQYTAGLLLDAAGSAATEQAADAANAYIAAQAAKRGLVALTRYSPGYGDWPLTDQQALVALANGERIGVTVTESCLLLPRKSVTAIIGLTPTGKRAAAGCNENGCENCRKENCFARKGFSR